MIDTLVHVFRREFIYLWYYSTVMLEQIAPYWAVGIMLGSVISVFGKDKIHQLFSAIQNKRLGIFGVIPASLLGILSPLCMYGTIPIAASFSQKGMRDDWLAAFMMSSILLNPQLILYSAALGRTALIIRIVSCLICGVVAGLLVRFFYQGKQFFDFTGFQEPTSRDTHPDRLIRLLKNIGRNIKATGGYFLFGIMLSALFQRYVPAEAFVGLFGSQQGFGVLMAATIGVPLYVCGGGTIPLLMDWLYRGMSMGAAASFMITGPATKITNLGAVKIVLGVRRFILYLLFIMLFALAAGVMIDCF
nr:permease [Desulfosporosinus fructosivorans]